MRDSAYGLLFCLLTVLFLWFLPVFGLMGLFGWDFQPLFTLVGLCFIIVIWFLPIHPFKFQR